MTRLLPACSFIVATALAMPHSSAQQAPPTKEELAQAKQLFDEGNALFKENKLAEAISKLEESYRLSRNAFLLYNIGHIYDLMGQKDKVLVYYKKFLADAPPNAQMAPTVKARIEELESSATPSAPEKPTEEVAEEAGNAQLQVQHELIFSAPPGRPLDVSIRKLDDPTLSATLFYRGAGDEKYASKAMIPRQDELVGHIPAKKVFGNSIQYYIEVRDQSGTLVTRSGKATVPHLVNIERGAPERAYPDLMAEDEKVVVAPPPEAPMNDPIGFRPTPEPVDTGPPFKTAKWIASGSAVALFGTSFASYMIARRQHELLLTDTSSCGTPPCREFDVEYARAVEHRGQQYDVVYKVTLGAGVAAAGVAAYFWYRSLTSKAHKDATAWLITPVVDDTSAGAAAAVRF